MNDICQGDGHAAVIFCLCQSKPVLYCEECANKHKEHESFPITQFLMFQMIGLEELKRRLTLSENCKVFMSKLTAKEEAIQTEAKVLIKAVNSKYNEWLTGDHDRFIEFQTTLEEETNKLLTEPKSIMSSITQTLHEKVGSLEFEDLNRFVRVPEEKKLMSLRDHCETACSRTRKAWQADTEREMIQALTTPQETHRQTSLTTQFTDAQAQYVAQSMELDALKQQAESQLTKQKVLEERTAGQAKEIEALKKQVDAQNTQQKATQMKLAKSKLFVRGLLVLVICSVLLNIGQISRPGFLRSPLEPDFPKGSEQGEDGLSRQYAARLEDVIDTLKSRIAFQDTHLETLSLQVKTAENRQAALVLELQDVNKALEESEQSCKNTAAYQEIDTLKKLNQSQTLQLSNTQAKLETAIQNGSGTSSTIDALKKQVESEARGLSDTQMKLAQVLTDYQTVSQLENRLRQWGITTDPPTSSQESLPDYSTEQSRAALNKFGNYSGTDAELVLVKRGPVIEESGVYIGQWNTRNEKHGYGQYLWQSGDCYEGLWRNGSRTGAGRYIWVNGDVYEGDFVQNKREGYGIQYYAGGDTYAGAWANDTRHGVGSYIYGESSQVAGDQYIGEYLFGKSDGVGAYFGRDGRLYVGSFKSGNAHGKGLMGYQNWRMYFGNFEDGLSSETGCSLSGGFWIYLLSLSIGSAILAWLSGSSPLKYFTGGFFWSVPLQLLILGVSFMTASYNQDFSSFWCWIGLGLIVVFGAIFMISANRDDKEGKAVLFGLTLCTLISAMVLWFTTITEHAELYQGNNLT